MSAIWVAGIIGTCYSSPLLASCFYSLFIFFGLSLSCLWIVDVRSYLRMKNSYEHWDFFVYRLALFRKEWLCMYMFKENSKLKLRRYLCFMAKIPGRMSMYLSCLCTFSIMNRYSQKLQEKEYLVTQPSYSLGYLYLILNTFY